MGTTHIRIDDRTEVSVKDGIAFCGGGWLLWMSLWVDGAYVDGSTGPEVPDLRDKTLSAAARAWYAHRGKVT